MEKIKKLTEKIVKQVLDEIKRKVDDEYKSLINYDDTLPNDRGIKVGYHRTGEEIIEMIKESLIQSYPPQSVIELVKSQFNIDDEDIFTLDTTNNMGPSHVIIILLSKKTDKQTLGKIKEFMTWSGYFLEAKPKPFNNKLAYSFEPKFGNNITLHIKRTFKNLYHLTPTKYLERIRKYGLIPKSKSKDKEQSFDYPDRVYLMVGNTLDVLQKQVLQAVAKNNKQDKSNPKDKGKFSLLTIDTGKLPNDLSFYADATSYGAIYTHDNIPPTAIVSVDEFEIK